jgi:hypothetical protein
MLLQVVIAVVSLAAPGQPLDSSWQIEGVGDWRVIGQRPDVVWQGNPASETGAITRLLDGPGNVWRCFVEPAPLAKAAGIWFGGTPDLEGGFLLTLGSGGAVLYDAEDRVLWQDAYALCQAYTPCVLEGIVEPGRVRVQMFAADRATLLAQSDWIETAATAPAALQAFGLYTNGAVARFYRWERAVEPLSPLVPDSPTKMRLVNDAQSPWTIVGNGDWRWTSPEKTAIRQGARVERSSAIDRRTESASGTWRCRVKVDEGAGGAGLLFGIDEKPERGFSAWLGGTFGDGALMLYRFPGQALWSGPQGQWHYGVEYVIEATIAEGNVSARLLAADGATVIAESPACPLEEAEKDRTGFIGYQTWKGTAEFRDFSK